LRHPRSDWLMSHLPDPERHFRTMAKVRRGHMFLWIDCAAQSGIWLCSAAQQHGAGDSYQPEASAVNGCHV
jgi:hypothetical protein